MDTFKSAHNNVAIGVNGIHVVAVQTIPKERKALM